MLRSVLSTTKFFSNPTILVADNVLTQQTRVNKIKKYLKKNITSFKNFQFITEHLYLKTKMASRFNQKESKTIKVKTKTLCLRFG